MIRSLDSVICKNLGKPFFIEFVSRQRQAGTQKPGGMPATLRRRPVLLHL
jgi:hypothetical protein